MQQHRVETSVAPNGTIVLQGLPFPVGETVEIVITAHPAKPTATDPYPLRGTVLEYLNPFEPVALTDWEVLQ